MVMLDVLPLRREVPGVPPAGGAPRRPSSSTMAVSAVLARVRRSSTMLEAMRLLPAVLSSIDSSVRAGARDQDLLGPILEAIHDRSDTLTALAAVHALARTPGARAAAALAELIEQATPGYEQHALWALSGREPAGALVPVVARAVARGGLTGTLAQQTLAGWASAQPSAVLAALEATLSGIAAAQTRRYVVETIGLVPGRPAARLLEGIALDASEHLEVRSCAVAAFVDRMSEPLPRAFRPLAAGADPLAQAVRETRARRHLVRRGPLRGSHADGVRVAHVHLGRTGGLATLLPRLGEALAGQQRIAETITIVRADAAAGHDSAATRGHRLERIDLADGEGVTFAGGWPSLVSAERDIRCALLAGPLPDVMHLRMADPGSYAAAAAAQALGIPIVFTLAADPHGPIAAAEAAGTLDRRSFVIEDGRSALWFRTRLVERLAREAREIVLFPRTSGLERIETLTGVDLLSGAPRHTIVAEGIDTEQADRAACTVMAEREPSAAIADLERALGRLPAARHGLPIVVSAGRMDTVKGMARLVEAFAVDASLASRANLVIVGGSLSKPSASEAAELTRIRRLFDRYPGLQQRVILLGERSHDEVAQVLALAHLGRGTLVAPGGSYACASPKEEFGLAILEAMAAGLPVTVPVEGGPATYVSHGQTGFVVDSADAGAIASGIRAALELALSPSTAARTRSVVDTRYTLDRMSRSLAAVYRVVSGPLALAAPVSAAA